MFHAPELRTERLRLRPLTRDDAGRIADLWQDPVVMHHFGGQLASDEDCWNRLVRYIGHWAVNGYGLWAADELETGTFVGNVGLFEGRRGLGERFDSAPEAGWMLVPTAHGKGYAREGMRAALNWGEKQHGWRRTVCMIDPANAPSIRTAESLGYSRFGTGLYRAHEISLFERVTG